jgi:Carbohydrate esterase, sialic acid-specific acetylesterase
MAGLSFGATIPVFIFAGQSEAINSGTDTGLMKAEALAPQRNVLFYNARTHTPATGAVRWFTYRPPTGPGFLDCGHTNAQGSFGPEFTAADLISRKCYGGGPVGVFKFAVGATDLWNQWNPKRPGLYPEMLSSLSNALAVLPRETGHTGRVAAVFWTQGERDALAGKAKAAAYGINLEKFVLALRRQFGEPRLPFIYGRILPQWQNSQGVREGQQALTNRLHDVFMANADDLVTPTLHYNNEGTMTLGNRYAEGFVALVGSRVGLTNQLNGAWRSRE